MKRDTDGQPSGGRAAPRLDDVGLLRELDVIGSRERGIVGLYPVSRSEWRLGVRENRYPQPIKIPGKHLTFWRRADILQMLFRLAESSP